MFAACLCLGMHVCFGTETTLNQSYMQCYITTKYHIYTSTKYLAGHADLLGGCLSYSHPDLGHKLHFTQAMTGPCMVSDKLFPNCDKGHLLSLILRVP